MASSLVFSNLARNAEGHRSVITGLVTMDSSYDAGGESFSLSTIGLVTSVDNLSVQPSAGYVPTWNKSTTAPKILVFQQSAATGALTEATGDLSAVSFPFRAVGA